MKILHVLDHSVPLHSGYTFRTLSILREQRTLGWKTFHLTGTKQGSGDALEEQVDDMHFYRTPERSNGFSKLPILNQIFVINDLAQRLNNVVEVVKPDIIHAHSPVLNALPSLQVGRKFGIPVVYEIRAFWEDAAVDHGTSREGSLRYRVTRALESFAIKRADAVTTICEGLKNDILARGVSAEKVTVIPNAVNIKNFSVGASPDIQLAQDLGLDDKQILGFIGSYYAYEGLNILLDSLPRILAKKKNVRVLLVGGGPQEDALKVQAAQLNITDKVTFIGRVPHDQVQRYYNLIDVLVYPRLKMRLTDLVTPLKPLEAMAQGRLLAASDVGGHRELIQDEKTGILFKANDAISLADSVLSLLNSPEKWDELRQHGRIFVETERSWPVSVSRYENVYSYILNKGSSS